jgi:hypothetical protein
MVLYNIALAALVEKAPQPQSPVLRCYLLTPIFGTASVF